MLKFDWPRRDITQNVSQIMTLRRLFVEEFITLMWHPRSFVLFVLAFNSKLVVRLLSTQEVHGREAYVQRESLRSENHQLKGRYVEIKVIYLHAFCTTTSRWTNFLSRCISGCRRCNKESTQ